MSLLDVKGLSKTYTIRTDSGRGLSSFRAVDDVHIDLSAGETLGIVGESGAGKSTLGRMILRLIEPDRGSIRFDGEDLTVLRPRALRARRARMQMVFQDPYSSLDPKMTIADLVAEPIKLHRPSLNRAARLAEVEALLQRVHIRPDQMDRYPYELSGGQLQRVAIARAISTEPKLIVCDEPVAALDVSIRAEIINLLRELQEERGVAYLFVSHDLSLVQMIAHRVVVMFQGRIVERIDGESLFDRPMHPYTRRLVESVPSMDPSSRRLGRMSTSSEREGHDGSWNGCAFVRWCPHGWERCRLERPPEYGTVGGQVRCHLYDPDEDRARTTQAAP